MWTLSGLSEIADTNSKFVQFIEKEKAKYFNFMNFQLIFLRYNGDFNIK